MTLVGKASILFSTENMVVTFFSNFRVKRVKADGIFEELKKRAIFCRI